MAYILFLCIIQGAGECLPISSSAHLYFLSLFGGYPPTTLDVEVALHLGSLIAICVFLWQPLWRMIDGFVRTLITFRMANGFGMAVIIVLATLPSVFIGFFVKRYFELPQTVLGIGIVSIVFGTLLLLAEKIGSQEKSRVTLADALIIGSAQVLAFIPGASRLGSCLTAARFLGIQRWQATQFSFLLAVPTILGAVVLTGIDVIHEGKLNTLLPLWPAVALTCAISLFVLKGLQWYVMRYSYIPFAFYRIILGIFLTYLAYMKL
ncbi:MAG: undecaprenyl-diphosphate phosphatase [Pseudomonadota bacterium]|nr:undecaprenyl-diphosphate phosphatase [Alphaproteobacteria bacterium]MDP5370429.1 undecaprenyl-diphosphate phosphatase [Pseudomonadota bacterium]